MNLTLVVENTQTQGQAYRLIEKHYRGNWEKLVPKYTKFLNSKERAEDVVQDAYLRCCTYWSSAPSEPEEFGKWFSTILGNCLKDNHRDEIMKGATSDIDIEEIVQPAAIPAIIYKQVVERIQAKPTRHSQILQLILLQQYRPSDVQAMTGETLVNIRKVVSRFRQDIKREFGWNI